MDRRDIDAAARGDENALRRVLNRFTSAIEQLTQTLGAAQQNAQTDKFSPPPLGSIAVTGAAGIFTVILTNDPSVNTVLLHELQSSTTVPFDASSTIIDYGVSSQQHYTISDAGKTYYWRFRSKLPGGQYNNWVQSDAVTD